MAFFVFVLFFLLRYLSKPTAQLAVPQNTKFPSGPEHQIQLLSTKHTTTQNPQLSLTDGN